LLDGTEETVAGGVGIGGLEKGAGAGIDGAAVWMSLDLLVTNSLKNWAEVSGSYTFRGGSGCSCKALARDEDECAIPGGGVGYAYGIEESVC
jgi:hypothetical protein